ncbi:hypothetical protein [Sorangium sp. So ce385]|uniref:hypothetical protein n=1 Tax=Sorangium sp. So ce385 TaxID=3133308 RepID=UPI003F5B2872
MGADHDIMGADHDARRRGRAEPGEHIAVRPPLDVVQLLGDAPAGALELVREVGRGAVQALRVPVAPRMERLDERADIALQVRRVGGEVSGSPRPIGRR